MDKPLLVIEVQDMDSFPRVIYKGEEMKGIISLNYYCHTKTEVEGKHQYEIEYCDKEALLIKKHGETKL